MKDVLNILISTGLFAIVVVWIIDRIREASSNKQLKELLIEELELNLRLLNDNIYEANESGKPFNYFPILFMRQKVFNAFVSTNKIIIFDKKTRKDLFSFYSGADKILGIIDEKHSLLKLFSPPEREEELVKIYQAMKRYLKYCMYNLEKGQLYEELERKGNRHQLIKTEKV